MAALLQDSPEATDRLGGSHVQIAEALARLVATSSGGKCVRLNGPWGSGKSTILKMFSSLADDESWYLQKNLIKKNVAVLTYDAWAHTGDPLRRSFFENLVNTLLSAGWLSSSDGTAKFWSETLQYFAKQRKVSEKFSEPLFSHQSRQKIAGLVTLAVVSPLIMSAFGRATADASIAFVIFLIATISSVLYSLIAPFTDSTLALILRRTTDTEKTTIVETPEPTALEFQEAFGSLMSEIFSQQKESTDPRRLIIVLDNMDRVETSEIRAIWALLRSFLDNQRFVQEPWFSKIWIVIPISDEERILKSENLLAAESDHAPHSDLAAKSFLEKIFQVQFSVPAPMVHQWKNYMCELIMQAFGDTSNEDIRIISSLYEEGNGLKRLTPRNILLFINSLVTLSFEWGDRVPLPWLAAYVLSERERIIGSNGKVVAPEFVVKILDPDRTRLLFAMLYHHAKDEIEASYLLFGDDMLDALLSGTPEKLSQYVSATAASEFVLHQIIRQNFNDFERDQGAIFRAARSLLPLVKEEVAKVVLTRATASLQDFRRKVFSLVPISNSIDFSDSNCIDGLSALIAMDETDGEFSANLLRTLDKMAVRSHKVIKLQKVVDINEGRQPQWESNLRRFLEFPSIMTSILKRDSSNPLHIPLEASEFMRMLYDSRNRDVYSVLERCTPKCGDEEAQDWLASRFSSIRVSEAHLMFLRVICDRSTSAFDRIAESVLEECRDSAGDGRSGIDELARNLLLYDPRLAKRHIRELVIDGTLLQALAYRYNVGDLGCWILWAGGEQWYQPEQWATYPIWEGGIEGPTRGAKAVLGMFEHHSAHSEFASEMVNFAMFDVLSTLVKLEGSQEFMMRVLRSVAENRKIISIVETSKDPEATIAELCRIESLNDEVKSQFIAFCTAALRRKDSKHD